MYQGNFCIITLKTVLTGTYKPHLWVFSSNFAFAYIIIIRYPNFIKYELWLMWMLYLQFFIVLYYLLSSLPKVYFQKVLIFPLKIKQINKIDQINFDKDKLSEISCS